jgi:uncharacterized protein
MRKELSRAPIVTFRRDGETALYNPLNHEIVFNRSLDQISADDPLFTRDVSFEKPELGKVRVELTLQCNAACSYCVVFENDVPRIGQRMDIETAESITRFFNDKVKGGTLMLLGGEPLTAWDITKHLFESCDASERTMFTNATLMTEERAKTLADLDVLVLVSLDGMERHNVNRIYRGGKPIFADTVEGLRTLQDAGAKVAISTVVTNDNVSDLSQIVRYYADELGVRSVGLTTPHHVAGIDFDLDVERYTREMIAIFDYALREGAYVDQIAKRVGPIARQKFKEKGCKIHGEQVTFYPDGSKSLCIKLDNIPDLSGKPPEHYYSRLPIFDTSCHSCYALGVCGGGCYLDAFFDPTGRDQRDCTFYPKMVEHIVWDMRSIADASGRVPKNSRLEKYGGMING